MEALKIAPGGGLKPLPRHSTTESTTESKIITMTTIDNVAPYTTVFGKKSWMEDHTEQEQVIIAYLDQFYGAVRQNRLGKRRIKVPDDQFDFAFEMIMRLKKLCNRFPLPFKVVISDKASGDPQNIAGIRRLESDHFKVLNELIFEFQ